MLTSQNCKVMTLSSSLSFHFRCKISISGLPFLFIAWEVPCYSPGLRKLDCPGAALPHLPAGVSQRCKKGRDEKSQLCLNGSEEGKFPSISRGRWAPGWPLVPRLKPTARRWQLQLQPCSAGCHPLSPRDWGGQGSSAHARREAGDYGAGLGGAVGAAGAAGAGAGLRFRRAGGLAGQPHAPPLPRLAQTAPAGPVGGHAEEAGSVLTA